MLKRPIIFPSFVKVSVGFNPFTGQPKKTNPKGSEGTNQEPAKNLSTAFSQFLGLVFACFS